MTDFWAAPNPWPTSIGPLPWRHEGERRRIAKHLADLIWKEAEGRPLYPYSWLLLVRRRVPFPLESVVEADLERLASERDEARATPWSRDTPATQHRAQNA